MKSHDAGAVAPSPFWECVTELGRGGRSNEASTNGYSVLLCFALKITRNKERTKALRPYHHPPPLGCLLAELEAASPTAPFEEGEISSVQQQCGR